MRLRIAFAVALAIAAAHWACGDQLPESEAADAGSDAPVGVVDAGDPSDATANADAPAKPFCDDVDASLCWSFDDTTKGSALFGPYFHDVSELPTLSNQARSAPNAMEGRGGGPSGQWLIEHTIVGATQSARCTAALFIEKITNVTEVLAFALGGRVVAFQLTPIDAKSVQAQLLFDRTGPQLASGISNLAIGTWTDITLTAERGAAASDIVLRAEALGTKAEKSLTIPDAGQNPLTDPRVQLGYRVVYGGEGAVRIDDVRCWFQ